MENIHLIVDADTDTDDVSTSRLHPGRSVGWSVVSVASPPRQKLLVN